MSHGAYLLRLFEVVRHHLMLCSPVMVHLFQEYAVLGILSSQQASIVLLAWIGAPTFCILLQCATSDSTAGAAIHLFLEYQCKCTQLT